MSDIDPNRCIKTVYDRAMNFPRGKQCKRLRAHGEYCAQHAPENVAKRHEEARETWRSEHARVRRGHEIDAAASAIVDAADKHFDYLPQTVRVAVEAWRKLKGM